MKVLTPSRAQTADVQPVVSPTRQFPDRYSRSVNHHNAASLNRPPHRTPIHDLTSHRIAYKPDLNSLKAQKQIPTPTSMTYLPSMHEKMLSSRRVTANVIGFDPNFFTDVKRTRSQGKSYPSESELDYRRDNAFSSGRSPRALRPSLDPEMARSEILKGQGLPATPRLLRGGNLKKYGIRRNISMTNQLELSPDSQIPVDAARSSLHFNTPADPLPQSREPIKTLAEDQVNRASTNNVLSFGTENTESENEVLTNRLVLRDRQKDAPWVYCYKVKRDRLKLSNLLTCKSATDPTVDQLLPAF